MKRTRDPEWTSRLLRAFSLSALCSFFFGAVVAFGFPGGWNSLVHAAPVILWAMMVIFWGFFLPLYVFTVCKSAAAVEWEQHAQLQDRRKTDLFRAWATRR